MSHYTYPVDLVHIRFDLDDLREVKPYGVLMCLRYPFALSLASRESRGLGVVPS